MSGTTSKGPNGVTHATSRTHQGWSHMFNPKLPECPTPTTRSIYASTSMRRKALLLSESMSALRGPRKASQDFRGVSGVHVLRHIEASLWRKTLRRCSGYHDRQDPIRGPC